FKVPCLAKILVDRSEPYIGDVIKRLQGFHDELADRFRLDVAFALALKPPHNPARHPLDSLGLDGTFAKGNLKGPHQLVALEWHATARPFHHGQFAQLNTFEGREASAAICAETSAADRCIILGWPRVLHLRFRIPA